MAYRTEKSIIIHMFVIQLSDTFISFISKNGNYNLDNQKNVLIPFVNVIVFCETDKKTFLKLIKNTSID